MLKLTQDEKDEIVYSLSLRINEIRSESFIKLHTDSRLSIEYMKLIIRLDELRKKVQGEVSK
jgi:hypothetical protein